MQDGGNRYLDLGKVVLAYAVAFGAAAPVWLVLRDSGPWLPALAADLVATVVVFAFSLLLRNSSCYDAYWSVIPLPIAATWAATAAEGSRVRQGLVLAILAIWGARLTWNWFRGWPGLHHEDWRYRDLRDKTGPAWPVVNFLGIHLFPTLLVFGGLLPVQLAVAADAPLAWTDLVGAGIAGVGIALETIADQQLLAFRRSKPAPEAILEQGLWSWSRHPNYLGEISVWVGLAVIGIGVVPASWWTGVGAVAMVGLFVGISIPMIERRMVARRPAYRDVQRRVSRLLLLPPRRR